MASGGGLGTVSGGGGGTRSLLHPLSSLVPNIKFAIRGKQDKELTDYKYETE